MTSCPIPSRETYSISCTSPGCRFAVVYLQARATAEEMARRHAERGHQVEIHRETRETVATVGGRTA